MSGYGSGGAVPWPTGMMAPPKMPGYQSGGLTQPPMEFSASAGGWVNQQAPAGYEWDPVQGKYIRTPTALGTATNQFNTAANPALTGLLNSFGSSTNGINSGFSSGFSGGGAAPTSSNSSGYGSAAGYGLASSPAGQGLARVGGIQLPDTQAATNAAFASAKDKSGQIARSSIDSLRGELGATGNLGGGAEVEGVRQQVNNASGIEAEAARAGEMKNADLAADFAKTRYGGEITQRGQDVAAQEAAANLAQQKELAQARLAFETNNANSQRQLQLLTLALSGLKGGAASVPGYSY